MKLVSSEDDSLKRKSYSDRNDDDFYSSATFVAPPTSIPIPNSDETEALLAKELNQLTFDERNDVLDDMHGVAACIGDEEDPSLVTQSLLQFDIELNKLCSSSSASVKKAEAYKLAMDQNPNYVQNEDFRLMFLRAKDFDVIPAVELMLKFLNMKKNLFGVDKVAQHIAIDDLGDDALSTLKAGYATILPGRDTSGRHVIVGRAQCGSNTKCVFSAVSSHTCDLVGFCL